ncbi:MAG TPA: hypothetical protein VFU86_09990, partial [Terriglobales bacterium]|nr:hypothetical protein [Terriglobales bacterium]
ESSAELTDEARTALQSELGRRGLRAAVTVEKTPVPTAQNPATSKPSESQFTSVSAFLTEVMSTYRAHFWLFVGLIAPAIVFGFYGREFSRMFGRHVLRQFLAHTGDLTSSKARFETASVGGIINFLTWTCFCVCYAGIASAVRRMGLGDAPSVTGSFDEVLLRPGRFLGVSTVLGILFVVATACLGFVYFAVITFLKLDFRSSTSQMLVYVLALPMVLLLSRLALAIPAVTLGNYTVRQSIFLSDEMTEAKWSLLAALLLKSIVGGYIAGMLPFWIAGWVWPYVHFYGWILTAASMAGVILVEPILFIGFSLLYLDAAQAPVQHDNRSVSVQLA